MHHLNMFLILMFAIYIYWHKKWVFLLLCTPILSILYLIWEFFLIFDTNLFWISVAVLSAEFFVFNKYDLEKYAKSFVTAPVLGIAACIIVDMILLGYIEPFWVIAIFPISIIIFIIGYFWGSFIYAIRRQNIR